MPHSHDHHHHDSQNGLGFAFFINLVYSMLEFFGYFLTKSPLLLSTAVHDFGDAFSIGISYFLDKLGDRKSTPRYSFGFKRLSIFGAIFMCCVIGVGSIFGFLESVQFLFNQEKINGQFTLIYGLISTVLNGLVFWRTSTKNGLNIKSVSLHSLEDVFGGIALVVSSIIGFVFNIYLLDAIFGIALSIFGFYNIFKILAQSLHILMQGTPQDFDLDNLNDLILAAPEVKSYHSLQVWSTDGNEIVLNFHICTDSSNPIQVKETLKENLNQHHFHISTIEVCSNICHSHSH
jgi:cobalt-zinc-cadmium efflux system protein